MKYFRYSALLVLTLLVLAGCREEEPYDKYARPDWLAGKVYTQILEDPELSTFALCVELIGYDTIIDVSGSYTVFAPDNAAFDQYFLNNPSFSSPETMPLDQLKRLVKYHIVQNPWTKNQLLTLDVWGWIDTLDITNDEPRGYKRKTLLLEDETKFGVAKDEDDFFSLMDTLKTSWHRMIVKDSRKFAPIFFKDYLDIYDLTSDDYEFYFDRPLEGADDLYYVGAKVTSEQVFAENGFVYTIDKVVEPLKNILQILGDEHDGNEYTEFRELVYQFPELEYNEQKTFDQAGYDLGAVVDSLFDLSFPDLVFNIVNEKTKAPRGALGLPNEVSIRYHHGIVAPTNAAMIEFEDEFLAIPNGWVSFENAPDNIQRIIVNTHMSQNPIYATDLGNGFYNGEADLITVDGNTAIHKEYGSNGTFIGVNEALVPRAFSSVAGPIYLKRGFSYAMYAIEMAGLLPALKRQGQEYTLYVESDTDCRYDSSLLYSGSKESFSVFAPGDPPTQFGVNQVDLRALLLNHIGTQIPRGFASKEFIKNVSGNFLIVDNTTNSVMGTAPTTDGYGGQKLPEPDIPVQISNNADNGITYSIKDWFSFSASSLYTIIDRDFPDFHALMVKSGLALTNELRYSFVSPNELYTAFIPTAQALIDVEADTITGQNLIDFCMLHFVVGDIIFTDGNKDEGYYKTGRIDESSTPFTKRFTQIYIEPGIDLISVPNNSGGTFVDLAEEGDLTNKISGRIISTGTRVFPDLVSTGAVHKVSKAFLIDELRRFDYTK
jgi:uncharacterized surface protein with fasciclin (FAS1) repeats